MEFNNHNIIKIIEKFVKKMNYLDNENFLGIFFYGSYLNGFQNENSDIDLHIVFNNSNLDHIYRGISYIDDYKIEYFEKNISDLYLSVDNDLIERNGSWYSMLGTSKILFEQNNELSKLKSYTLNAYSKPLPKMDEQDILENIAIINNRIEKLTIACKNDDPSFYNLYHITIEKIRRFYHAINGYPKINTSKIVKVYKDDLYRQTYFKGDFVNEEFKMMYFDLIILKTNNKQELLDKIIKFYDYVKDGRKLEKEFKIKIKSRNK